MQHTFYSMNSPLGALLLVSSVDALTGVIFEKNWDDFAAKLGGVIQARTPVLEKAEEQLDEYFAGKRQVFDLPLRLTGTSFQNSVWQALAEVPYAETRSYKYQANLIGSPKAVRAVGRTNGLNPLCIVLPCHRIIGSDGSLTGYGGGLENKQFLLEHERKNARLMPAKCETSQEVRSTVQTTHFARPVNVDFRTPCPPQMSE